MDDIDLESIYRYLIDDLMDWIISNPKTSSNISGFNAKRMFTFDQDRRLIIDLPRFNEDYYDRVFKFIIGQKNISSFLKKVCLIIRDSLIKHKKYDLKIEIVIKERISTYKNDFYIHPKFTGETVKLRN